MEDLYIFGIFLAEGLVETLNQCILQGGNRENSVVKLYQKV